MKMDKEEFETRWKESFWKNDCVTIKVHDLGKIKANWYELRELWGAICADCYLNTERVGIIPLSYIENVN